MPLLPDHDHAISSFIGAFLAEEAQKIAFDDDEAMQAILSSTRLAIAAFAERWNARARVHVRLPPELLALCFGALSFDNRLTISHVSRQWRAIALGTPSLWATFRISSSGRHHGKLAEMLRRSQAAPLSVELLLTPDEESLLRPHFARLRELVCEYAPKGSLDAQMLRKLVVQRRFELFVLSAQCVGAAASSLETLQLEEFVLAPSCPVFRSLRVFSAFFTRHEETCLSTLLVLCPALESLTVRCDIELGGDPRALFVPLPESLREIFIKGLSSFPDATALVECDTLQPWSGHAFRRLQIDYLIDLSGILQWFVGSYIPQPWSLTLLHPWNVGIGARAIVCILRTLPADLRDDATRRNIETLIEIFSHGDQFVQGLIPLQEHFGRLKMCTVSPSFFAPLVTQGVHLPALTTFTLAVDTGDYNTNLPLVIPGGGGISAPALRSFVLMCHESYRTTSEEEPLSPGAFQRRALDWFYGTLPRELRKWILYDAPRLETLALEGLVNINDLPRDIMKISQVYDLADVVQALRWNDFLPS